jgi:hypothetical protein
MRFISLILLLLFLVKGPARAEDVTPAMEQAFLAKYKAAVQKKDIDAYLSLFCMDPGINAKAKAYMMEMVQFGLAVNASNPNATYAFVPITPGQQNKPSQINGKTHVDILPTVIAFKVTFAKPDNAATNGYFSGSTNLLAIKDHQLMFVDSKEKR